MKNKLKILYPLLVLMFSLFLNSVLYGQNPNMPPDHLIRSQFDGMMNREVNMITDFYDDEVEVYQFPNVLLAKGKENAKKYWAGKFEEKKEIAYELETFVNVGSKTFAQARKVDPVAMTKSNVAIILELKGDKILRVLFIE